MSKQRKTYAPEEKVSVLRRHVIDTVAVSRREHNVWDREGFVRRGGDVDFVTTRQELSECELSV